MASDYHRLTQELLDFNPGRTIYSVIRFFVAFLSTQANIKTDAEKNVSI